MAPGGGIFQRCARANIVSDILGNTIGKRRILVQEFSHTLQIADARGRANVNVGAARSKVRKNFGGSGRHALGHISPASIIVVSIRELDRAGAVESTGIDIGTASQQLVDHLDLPGHDRPVNRLVRP